MNIIPLSSSTKKVIQILNLRNLWLTTTMNPCVLIQLVIDIFLFMQGYIVYSSNVMWYNYVYVCAMKFCNRPALFASHYNDF